MLARERFGGFSCLLEDIGQEGVVVGTGLVVIVIDEEDDICNEKACDEDGNDDGCDLPSEYFWVFSLFAHEGFMFFL